MQRTYFHNKWDGLMVGMFDSILKVNGLNFTCGVCDNGGKLIKYSPI